MERIVTNDILKTLRNIGNIRLLCVVPKTFASVDGIDGVLYEQFGERAMTVVEYEIIYE